MPSDLNFCARCGAPLIPRDDHGHTVLVCTNPACGRIAYRNAKPCAAALVESDGRVLLVRRAIEPFKDAWDIPGGFLQEWEHPAEAACRELLEETGLEIELTALLGIFIDRYAGSENTLNVYYRARQVGGTLIAADDAAEAGWFAPAELPVHLAFPDHERQVLAVWQAAMVREPQPLPAPQLTIFVSSAVLRDE